MCALSFSNADVAPPICLSLFVLEGYLVQLCNTRTLVDGVFACAVS